MDYNEYRAQVIAEATTFVASSYAGRATYHRVETGSRVEAIRAARTMIAQRPAGDIFAKARPVRVYAVRGTIQVVADTVWP